MNRWKRFLSGMVAVLSLGGPAATAGQASLVDRVRLHSARARIVHQRPKYWLYDLETREKVPAYYNDDGELVAGRRWQVDRLTLAAIPDQRDVFTVSDEETSNVKTTVGIDFIFSQSYNSTAAAQTNGLAWIALSNDTVSETSASTTLSNEITTNGLGRTKGTYAHSAGASTSTIANTFTATGAQSCQKAALFSASSSGTMNHVLSFTQRSLQTNDTIAVTFTVTIT